MGVVVDVWTDVFANPTASDGASCPSFTAKENELRKSL